MLDLSVLSPLELRCTLAAMHLCKKEIIVAEGETPYCEWLALRIKEIKQELIKRTNPQPLMHIHSQMISFWDGSSKD
jgi:hypothetical protein